MDYVVAAADVCAALHHGPCMRWFNQWFVQLHRITHTEYGGSIEYAC